MKRSHRCGQKSIVIVFSRKGKCASSHQYRCAKKQRTKLIYASLCRRWRRRARCQNRFVYPENIKKNLPVTSNDDRIGSRNGYIPLLDGTYLTQLRTGAVQGAATKLLAKEDAKSAR